MKNNNQGSGATIEETMSDIGNKRVLAFLDNLLTQNIKNPELFTEKDVRAEVDTFMSAGQDTSSATTQFALQLIGHYPEVQVIIFRSFVFFNYFCNFRLKYTKSWTAFMVMTPIGTSSLKTYGI